MTPEGPNPLVVYAFPAVVLAVVLLYVLYGAIDRAGLPSVDGEARVTGKQHAAGSTTYTTEVVAGRSWTRAHQNPEAFIVTLELNGESTGGAVSRPLFEALQPGERVHVRFGRTRLSKRLLVTDVSR